MRANAGVDGGCEGENAALTVGLSADEAGGGAVKEGEKAGHGEADVGVSWPQVQGGEAGHLDLQNILRSHLDVGHLQGHRGGQGGVSAHSAATSPCHLVHVEITGKKILQSAEDNTRCKWKTKTLGRSL